MLAHFGHLDSTPIVSRLSCCSDGPIHAAAGGALPPEPIEASDTVKRKESEQTFGEQIPAARATIATVRQLESQRERLQARLDALKTQRERNVLGQFATPGPLVAEIVESVQAMVGASNSTISFMDPAFGTGAFYSALLHVSSPSSVGAARGYEIDPHYGRPAAALWRTTGLRLELCDFTVQRPSSSDDLVDLLICNPPYVRHHHIKREMKQRLAADVERLLRLRVSGLAGLYVYFMLTSHQWLKPNALSVWLVPSEFLDVNYGSVLKEYLLDRVDLVRIHRFDPAHVLFGDAMVSSAVVWFWNRQPDSEVPEFTFGGSVAEPSVRRRIDITTLRNERKWTRLPGTATAASNAAPTKQRREPSLRTDGEFRLADLFAIKRGIVTGANSFFILDEVRAHSVGVSSRFLRPLLPSPRHLQTDVVEATDNGVPDIAKPLYLFDCRLSSRELRRADPGTASYVKRGEAAELHRGYLASRRDPWYAQEHRAPAPFLCTYMGRSVESRAPFRVVLNHSDAIATNVYLMLYPRAPLRDMAACPAGRRAVWQALRQTVEMQWSGSGRVYGGGLHKVEPRELGRMPAGWLIDAHPELCHELVRQPMLL